eukprot:11198985-Lingulodinium_polyedra.AAC.1
MIRPEAALSGRHAGRCPAGGARLQPGGGARWARPSSGRQQARLGPRSCQCPRCALPSALSARRNVKPAEGGCD